MRIGGLDNTKWNASKLLCRVVRELETGQSLVEVRFYTRINFPRPVETELLDWTTAENDTVISAIGD